jgi:hypothetical protein
MSFKGGSPIIKAGTSYMGFGKSPHEGRIQGAQKQCSMNPRTAWR